MRISHDPPAFFAISRVVILALVFTVAVPGARGQNASPLPKEPCKVIVLGFQGGIEFAKNKRSGIIQIEKQIRDMGYADVCSKTYTPYSWLRGDRWAMKHFPRHRGMLSPSEIENAPKVILYGHSLGGWATLSIARKLGKRGIPVELTVQIASVGVTDRTVPANVKTAANFYTNDIVGLIGTKHICAKDKRATAIIENRNLKDTDHVSITRDPRIAALILGTIRSLREPAPTASGGEYPYCY